MRIEITTANWNDNHREASGDGANDPLHKKDTNRPNYLRWSEAEVSIIKEHPTWTNKQLCELMPHRSLKSIRNKRQRIGRFTSGGVCTMCEERPVWSEQKQAKAAKLCKGCYLAEQTMRLEEEKEYARIRKARGRLAEQIIGKSSLAALLKI